MEENNIFLASFSPLNDWVFPKIVISQKRTLKVHLKIRESLFLYRTKQDDISEGRKNEVHRPFSDQQVKKEKKERKLKSGWWLAVFTLTRPRESDHGWRTEDSAEGSPFDISTYDISPNSSHEYFGLFNCFEISMWE